MLYTEDFSHVPLRRVFVNRVTYATFGYVIIRVFRYFQSVVECPDLSLMFSLFKEFLCCVLVIVSVFGGKLVIDNSASFVDLIASVFVGNASVLASKLDIDGWAPFSGSVEASGASGTILYITIKVSPKEDLPFTVVLSWAHWKQQSQLPYSTVSSCKVVQLWKQLGSRYIYHTCKFLIWFIITFCNCNFLEIQVFVVVQFLYLVAS